MTPTPAEPRNSAIPLKSLYAPEPEADEIPVKDDGAPVSVTETQSQDEAIKATTAGQPLPAMEIDMAENEEGKTVTPEFDYEKLADMVARKLDVPGSSKSVPAVIKAENLGDPDPYRALARWAAGGSSKASAHLAAGWSAKTRSTSTA